jgi:peptidoglycan/xylan/chitin deacetylase (PgdA/CDA1 family)
MDDFMFKILLAPMYHRVHNTYFQVKPDIFQKYITKMASKYQTVVPGDKLDQRISVCLTFDDAYYDFYHFVYPLLKELNIKAVLAVAPKFILDSTNLSAEERFNVPYNDAVKNGIFQEKVPFCTWEELSKMQQSGHVIIASHSFNHSNMTDANIDFEKEVVLSKQEIENKLKTSVDIFVYPFGKMNKDVHKLILKHYTYVMRIGSALNKNWQNRSNCIYRFDAEHYWPQGKMLKLSDYTKLYYKYLCNSIRKK